MKYVDLQLAADGVALVTLNDSVRRNAVTSGMRDEIVATFAGLEVRDDVRAVVITGAGSSFCAGADLADLAAAGPAELREIYDAFLAVARSPLPTVAAVNGPAVGAGMNLALACDVRIAARSARFVAGFLRVGLHPGGGSTWMLKRVVGAQVLAALVLFEEGLDGEEADRLGLVLRCVDDADLLSEAIALAERVASAPPALVGRIKQTLWEIDQIDALDSAVELELEAQAWSLGQDFFRERIVAARASSRHAGAPRA
jgi:enoyl-CoA hydratase